MSFPGLPTIGTIDVEADGVVKVTQRAGIGSPTASVTTITMPDDMPFPGWPFAYDLAADPNDLRLTYEQ